jgi:DNA-directed RNA polymerase II subunit RPB2
MESAAIDNPTIWKIINTYFRDNPKILAGHHIDSYNDFIKKGIFQIFRDLNPIRITARYDEKTDEFRSEALLYLGGRDGTRVYFGKPVIYDDQQSHYMFPNEARLRNMTYGMTIHYDVEVEFIDILEEGEAPRVVGLEKIVEEKSGEVEDDDDSDDEGAAGKVKQVILGGGGAPPTAAGGGLPTASSVEGGAGAGAKSRVGPPSGAAPKNAKGKRASKKTRGLDRLTPAETSFLRELTEKSLVQPNVQRRTIELLKIYLGKFPIMLHSDFCILNGLPRETLHIMGECRNDIGGYFIIDGKEKVIIPQENFGNNMMYVRKPADDKFLWSAEIRSVSENIAKPIRTLAVKLMAPTKKYSNLNLVVSIPNVRKPVPLFIVFRALGVLSDKAIIKMCLLDTEKYKSLMPLFVSSVYDAGAIMTQTLALKYIATLTKWKTLTYVLEILSDYFLPHIGETNFLEKAYYLGHMVFRTLLVHTGIEEPTKRDNFRYKRIETDGVLLAGLFREYFKIQHRKIQLGFEEKLYYNQAMYEDNLFGLIDMNYKEVFRERAVDEGFRRAFKGAWGSAEHTRRVGVVQDLNRLSFNSFLNNMRKTVLSMDSDLKVVEPRLLNNSQWGFFDPIDTPDGGNIGMHKHLSISAYITKGYSREGLVEWCRQKVSMKPLCDCTPEILAGLTRVFVNGALVGALSDPVGAVAKIKLYRRNALLPIHTSVAFDKKYNVLEVYTDAGRVSRPIFYKNEATGKFSFQSKRMLDILKGGKFSWEELITGFNEKAAEARFDREGGVIYELSELYRLSDKEGAEGALALGSNPAQYERFLEDSAVFDYIDPNETEDALIALNAEELAGVGAVGSGTIATDRYTHLEIHESFLFGMMCNLITFPENNPATRNNFSCGQSKQAISLYHTNFHVRMDKMAVVLNYGQSPLVKTRYYEHICNDENPYGENAIVAIMCFTGYNVEDAVLINEGALKRGLFRTTYFTTYEAHEEKKVGGGVGAGGAGAGGAGAGVSNSEILFTNIERDEMVMDTKPGIDYSHLDAYGLIRENTEVNDKMAMIGLAESVGGLAGAGGGKKRDVSKMPKKGQLGVVDKTFITEGEQGQRIAKVRIREERIPNLGDKMASRNGQKGTVGLIIPEANMPFTADGLRPDIIINPHAIPTRMTIGQLVECITGKAAAIYGGFADCTAFNNRGSKIGVFGEALVGEGFHSSGNEILYDGMTGKQLEAAIFMGPTYYMRLKHMVKDKVNFRALGPRTALTRQPVGGRANDGGLRIGEMERDGVLAHGMSDFLRESMMERGDKYYMAVCNQSGLVAIYNPSKNLFMSPAVDGPIQYVGSVDGKDVNISHVTRFGRSFSVICIPYSLKLLIQELQTINIQMRVITEDNIEQMSNLMYSDNIKMLTQVADITPNKVIEMIREGHTKTNRFRDVPAAADDDAEADAPSAVVRKVVSETDENGNSLAFLLEDTAEPDAYVPSVEPGSESWDTSPEYTPNTVSPPKLEESETEYKVRMKPNLPIPVGFPADQIWSVVSINNRFMTVEAYDQTGALKREVVSVNDVERVDPEMEKYRQQMLGGDAAAGMSNRLFLGGAAGPLGPTLGGGGGGESGIRFSPNINIITGGENNISGVGLDAGAGAVGGGLTDVTSQIGNNPVGQSGGVGSGGGGGAGVSVLKGGSGGGGGAAASADAEPNFNQPLMVVKKG